MILPDGHEPLLSLRPPHARPYSNDIHPANLSETGWFSIQSCESATETNSCSSSKHAWIYEMFGREPKESFLGTALALVRLRVAMTFH